MSDFTLYHWEPNANSGKPLMVLIEKGVKFESRYIDVSKFEHHRPEYLEINPLGVVPAATHGDLKLYESTAIMEYVDAAFDGLPLRPADPEGRWRMRWWMKFFDEYYAPSVSMGAWARGRRRELTDEERAAFEKQLNAIPQKERREAWAKSTLGLWAPGELEESARKASYAAALMEGVLGEREWLAGDEFSLADINAFNLCYFMPMMEGGPVSDAKTPLTMEWLRKIYERPSAREAWSYGRLFTADRLTHLARSAA